MVKINLHYKIEGSGKTLAFIHGLSDNLLYWEFLATNLKDDYRVLRFDLRGHGESELGDEKIAVGTYVDDLKGLLDELNIDNVTLVGFSLGGAVALDFAIRYPQRVSSLVLMSSFYGVDSYSGSIFNQFKNTLSNSFEDFYDYILPMVLCPEVIEENKVELELLKGIASQSANTEAFVRAVDAALDFNVEDELSEIDVPTLILAGRYDDIFPLKTQKEMQSKINTSRLIVLDDVKHNILVGKNNEKILNILKKEM